MLGELLKLTGRTCFFLMHLICNIRKRKELWDYAWKQEVIGLGWPEKSWYEMSEKKKNSENPVCVGSTSFFTKNWK